MQFSKPVNLISQLFQICTYTFSRKSNGTELNADTVKKSRADLLLWFRIEIEITLESNLALRENMCGTDFYYEFFQCKGAIWKLVPSIGKLLW